MTKKGFRNLLILSGISMSVLVAIQLYLFTAAYSLKEVEFDGKVNKVLDQTVSFLEKRETAARVKRYFNRDTPIIRNRVTMLTRTPGASPVDRVALRESRAYRDSIINKELLNNLVQVFSETDSSGSTTLQRIVRFNLDSVLRAGFVQQGLDVNFQYHIKAIDRTADTAKTRQPGPGKNKVYTIRLYPSFGFPVLNQLVVEVKNRQNAILRSLTFYFIISVLVFLLLLFTIGKSVLTLLRQKKLSQVQKDFVNNVTHELKTPIASIGLAADSVLNEKVIHDADQIRFYTERIVKENNRIDEKIERILRSSAAEEEHFRINAVLTDVHDIISEALEEMQVAIENSSAQVHTDLRAKNSLVLVDEWHFRNVVVNLLDNALKYSKTTPEIEILTNNDQRQLILMISDKGVGISEQDKKHIFKKFFRGASAEAQQSKGFGIGLSYVYNIVRAHSGKIEVRSVVDKGSSFIIKLPLQSYA